jgi:membrane associated rhomboid family serine protease
MYGDGLSQHAPWRLSCLGRATPAGRAPIGRALECAANLKAAAQPGDTLAMLDQAKTDRWPLATVTLIGINALLFVFELSAGPRFAPFLQEWGLVPARVSNEFGARNVLTIVTSLFLQVGWLQLLGTVWLLWAFGDAVEGAFDWRLFVVIYLLSGLIANVAFTAAASSSATPALGASGAVAGVLGAGIVLFPRAHVRLPAVLVVFLALMLTYELGLRIGISATVLNIAGGFGIGGGPVLFALSMLLTIGWLVMSAQRRRGGVSVEAVLKSWRLPVWVVVAFFCLQSVWSGTMTIVSPQFGSSVNVWACLGGLGAGAILSKILPRRQGASAEPVIPAYYLAGAERPVDRGASG